MLVLGIESSCDECAAAILEDGKHVLSSVVSSQIDLHALYGGIVPEIAARRHVETVIPVLKETMSSAGIGWSSLDGIAVTRGPGLVGSLLVGVTAAKAIAVAHHLPIVGVNHLEGHICANYFADPPPDLPAVCLVVSGGHTDLFLVMEWGKYRWLGGTLDDAAGETMDKIARCAGLGYPGGPIIDRLSQTGCATAFNFPRSWLDGRPDFSFSGLKTAVVRTIQKNPDLLQADLAASVQAAIVDVLVKKTLDTAMEHQVGQVMVAGGVAANSALRSQLEDGAIKRKLRFTSPSRSLCTDNAVMIAVAGWFRLSAGESDDLKFDTIASLPLGEPLP